MVNIGWMQDAHIDPNDANYGVGDHLWQDHNTLDTTYNVDDILWTGDQVAVSSNTAERETVPRATPEHYDRFWSLVDQADNPDLVRYAIPGNHECPIGMFLKSDPRAVLRAKIEYGDGVTVFMINTHTTGFVTGSPNNGIGWSYPMASYTDLQWLEEELQAAEDRGDAKIVLTHAAPVQFDGGITERDIGRTGRYPTTADDSNIERMYESVMNQTKFHTLLSSFTDVVVPTSHQFTGANAQDTYEGVHYLHTSHYYNSNGTQTFGYIEADSSNVVVKAIEHSDGSEHNLLDLTL